MYNNKIVQADLKAICETYNFEKLKNKNVVVTGATGMLATYYTSVLMYLNDNFGYGIKIYALARNEDKLKKKFGNISERDDFIPIIQDICDKISINEKVDYILHAAGSASPEALTKYPTDVIMTNIIGAKNVLDLAKEKNARIIFTSTREVYGAIDGAENISEEMVGKLDQTDVRSCYPESKRLIENLIICHNSQFGTDYRITRLAHAYGPGMAIEKDGRIMSDLIGNAVRNEEIILKSTGEALRAFCYVADAVAALLLVTVSNNDERIYNISNETEETSIKNLAEKIASIYSLNIRYELSKDNTGYVKFKRVALDNTKLKKLGWKPIYNLTQGVENTVTFSKDENV